MPLPTLLRTGFISPHPDTPKQEKERIKNMRSIDFIINFISDRTPVSKGSKAKIPAKGPGDRVLVLKSDTGSGKSTVLAPTLYEIFQDRVNKNIAITQPRVLTAIDICEGLPEFYPFLEIDENLGYLTGNFKRRPSNKGIIFMTIGILLQQMKIMDDEAFMNKYSFILIDEVHERSIDVDMSLYLIKKFLTLHYDNPECPMIILMSATFQPKIFMDYYDIPKSNLINVVGSTFPIEKHFLEYDTHNFIQTAINIAERLHVENISDIDDNQIARDILIFVKGAAPVRDILAGLNLFNAKVLSKGFSHAQEYISDKKKQDKTGGADVKHYYIAPIELTGTSFYLSGSEYQNLFSDIENISVPVYKINDKGIATKEVDYMVKPVRRIIVATNIAETGVTIETLKYCIDTGFVNSSEFNPDFGVSALFTKNVTKGMATQRKGRVGRKAPGEWYPCYTEKTFNALDEDQFADILSEDVTESMLNIIIKETEVAMVENEIQKLTEKQIDDKDLFLTNYISDRSYYSLKYLKSFNTASVDFLESPSATSLNYSIEKLHGLGFIDNELKPTRLGFYAFKFRKVSMENRRMLLSGYAHGANLLDLITIVSFAEVGKRYIFHRKYTPMNIFSKKLNEKEHEFYSKIIIGDEMIEYILIWEMLSEFLNGIVDKIGKKSKTSDFSLAQIEMWCIENKLQYDGITRVIAYRDELIESFITIGLNPYYNGLGIDKGSYNLLNMFRFYLSDFITEVKKIKHCIMDGYRFNLCIWDDSSKKYILYYRNIPIYIRSNVNTRMGDDAIQSNPNYLIPSNIMLRESMKNKGMYEFESNESISVMDSYVDVDLNFLKH